jgi:tRNA-guanine family transglycosylase
MPVTKTPTSLSICQRFSRAYLHHLVKIREGLGDTLLTLHNLTYYQHLMARLRQAIVDDNPARLQALADEAETAGRPT